INAYGCARLGVAHKRCSVLFGAVTDTNLKSRFSSDGATPGGHPGGCYGTGACDQYDLRRPRPPFPAISGLQGSSASSLHSLGGICPYGGASLNGAIEKYARAQHA
ncbi:hypothetical protein CSUI_002861, partial [Cystoisospora suis]